MSLYRNAPGNELHINFVVVYDVHSYNHVLQLECLPSTYNCIVVKHTCIDHETCMVSEVHAGTYI